MTTKGIDFGTLSLRDALDLAILIEEEAKERYEEFADQMELHHTEDAAAFFRFMAWNEEKHREELAARRGHLFQGELAGVTRAMLFDVEAPEYDQARAFMTAREAMQAALVSETKAHDFFVAALPRIQDADVRRLFEELREEEIEHLELVRKELAKLPPDPGHRPDDFGDEPVAH